MTETNAGIKAVDKTIDIVEELQRVDSSTVSEIAERLDLPTSTVYYHLQTMKDRGFVVKQGMEYRLGLKFLEIGGKIRAEKRVYKVAKPQMKSLAQETGEMCNLLIEEQGQGFHVYRAEGESSVLNDPLVGQSGLLHCRALGKAVLAFLPPDEVDGIVDRQGLPKLTENTIVDRTELEAELAEIRERGVAFDDEERLIGLRCVASPIKDNNGAPVASISLTGPKERMRDERFDTTLPEKISNTANVIEANISYDRAG